MQGGGFLAPVPGAADISILLFLYRALESIDGNIWPRQTWRRIAVRIQRDDGLTLNLN